MCNINGFINTIELAIDWRLYIDEKDFEKYERIIAMKKKIKYEVTVKFNAVFDYTRIGEIKSNDEFATDISAVICDEIANAGGVAIYNVLESKIDIE